MASQIRITFEVPGADTLESYFNHVRDIPDDFRGAWEPMAEDFWENNAQTFFQQGPGWKPLSPSTVKDRQRHGLRAVPILVRSGALMTSLTDEDADGAIYEVYPKEMSLGTDLKTPDGRYVLGMLHQTGTRPHKNSPHGMPARPPVKITDELQTRWNQRLANWLHDELNYQG